MGHWGTPVPVPDEGAEERPLLARSPDPDRAGGSGGRPLQSVSGWTFCTTMKKYERYARRSREKCRVTSGGK